MLFHKCSAESAQNLSSNFLLQIKLNENELNVFTRNFSFDDNAAFISYAALSTSIDLIQFFS